MAASKSTPRTAVEIADDIGESIARVRAVSTTICLAAANETPGVGELDGEDLAALRGIVSDLLSRVQASVDELRSLTTFAS